MAPNSLALLSLRCGTSVCSVSALTHRTWRKGLGTSFLVKALRNRQLPSLSLGGQVTKSTALRILLVRTPGHTWGQPTRDPTIMFSGPSTQPTYQQHGIWALRWYIWGDFFNYSDSGNLLTGVDMETSTSAEDRNCPLPEHCWRAPHTQLVSRMTQWGGLLSPFYR